MALGDPIIPTKEEKLSQQDIEESRERYEEGTKKAERRFDHAFFPERNYLIKK